MGLAIVTAEETAEEGYLVLPWAESTSQPELEFEVVEFPGDAPPFTWLSCLFTLREPLNILHVVRS